MTIMLEVLEIVRKAQARGTAVTLRSPNRDDPHEAVPLAHSATLIMYGRKGEFLAIGTGNGRQL
jgi:hypothetical protein